MTYLEKLNKIAKKIALDNFTIRVEAINQVVRELENKEIPTQKLPQIEILPDEEEFLSEKLNETDKQELKIGISLLNNFRQFLSLRFGLWSLSNKQTCELLKEEFNLKTGLEIMAGNAMWGRAFADVGVKMTSTDDLSWSKTSETGSNQFMPVLNYDAKRAIEKFGSEVDFIIFSWAPNFGRADLDVLELYRNMSKPPLLIMVGEQMGATNSPEFWQKAKIKRNYDAKIKQSFTSFDFIEEEIIIVE